MKSLIFDVDGTILDSMPMWLELENNILKNMDTQWIALIKTPRIR